MAKKVCLDAGHYGKYNRCPNNSAYYESEVMWKLHLLQKKYLEQLGIEVILTRADQTKDYGLTARGQKAKGCDLFISNHSNAVGSGMNETVDHCVIYHQTNDTATKCDDVSKEFAPKIAKVITDVMGLKQPYRIAERLSDSDRNGDGKLNDNYYAVLHGARLVGVPAMIVEHSFHTNTNTVKWLLNDANLDKLAKAEAECIAEYLGVKKQVVTQTDYPDKFDKGVAGIYTVTADDYLVLRRGANTSKAEILRMNPKEEVKCYGSYTKTGNTTWLLVVYKGEVGYASKGYLKKK